MKVAGVLAFVLRESRGARGRLAFFTGCVAIGVAAVVAVAGLSAGLSDGLESQSRELMAADFQLEAHAAFGADLDAILDEVAPGIRRTDVRELATMAGALDSSGAVSESHLVELKVIRGTYPFYGRLGLHGSASADAMPNATTDLELGDLLRPDTVVVAPELVALLELEIGDDLRLGGADFRIAGLVLDEPDRLGFSLTLGPRVFLSQSGLERTTLIGVGNRVRYRTLLALDESLGQAELLALGTRVLDAAQAAGAAPPAAKLATHHSVQPGVRRGLERFRSYLGLVALISLILGGIGVAEVVRSWLRSKMIGIAVWRSLGIQPREILLLYLLHAGLLALLGSLIGAACGGLLPFLLPRLIPDLLDPELVNPWQPAAYLRGMGLGLGVALIFALPVLTSVWRVPPAMVLRSSAEPLSAPLGVRSGALLLLALGLFGSAFLQVGRADHALWFTGGIALSAGVLYVGARLLVRLAASIPRGSLPPILAHGVGALARPGAGTVGAIVALGLGSMVVIGMALVDRGLTEELHNALPTNAPSVFLVDVQKDQWTGVQALLEEAQAQRVDMVPVIMARLSASDVAQGSAIGSERPSWALGREQRLTYLDELPSSNRIVAGELWSDPEHVEISLEQSYAESLGVELGDTLTFNVQGVEFDFLLTSLREVSWESFEINFFLVVEPGVLDEAPQFRMVAALLEPHAEDLVQNRLVDEFPNVTMYRVRPIIERVARLLTRVALAVRFLGAFTILAGIAILAGAVSATQAERGRDVALLKTLGVPRKGILALFATEFALAGLVAGLLGVLGAYGLAWAFLERVLQLDGTLPWALALPAVFATALLATVAGIAASARALAARPVESLRG